MSEAHFSICKADLLQGMRHKIICAISLSSMARGIFILSDEQH